MTGNTGIRRYDIHEQWKHAGVVEAGDFCFVGYCVGDFSKGLETQIRGALDHLERRLELVGLTLQDVVKVDLLFRDIWDIPVMEQIFEERFAGCYPARKSIQTAFGEKTLLFQMDAIAWRDPGVCQPESEDAR